MTIVSRFEPAFLAWLAARLQDESILLFWARSLEGTPATGQTFVVIFGAGGETSVTFTNVSDEHGRNLEFHVMSPDPQDVKDACKKLHRYLNGGHGILSDGSEIFNIIPRAEDIDDFLSEEKLEHTFFTVEIRMIEGPDDVGS